MSSISPQVPRSAITSIDGGILDDECKPDILILAQASTTTRPQPVDYVSGDESVSSQAPATTSEPHTLGERDAWSREADPDPDSKPLISTRSPTIDRSHMPVDARNPIEIPLVTPEDLSINGGGRDTQSREAGYGVDPGFSISTDTTSVATEPYSVVYRDGDMRSEDPTEEVPSVALFPGASNFGISNTTINAIGGNATIIRFGDGQFTEFQRNMICDYIAILTVLPDINDNLMKHVLTQLIINLPRAEAVFDDYQTKKKSGPCFEGTRVALLREMADWTTGPDASRVYVLSGLAGIGKSTVAYTIASRAADLNLLGASFFFSRGEADRNNAKRFFSTIAYQLCVYNEAFAKAIGDVLKTDRGSAATTKDPQNQLLALILDPLRSIVQSRSRPILIVVDALDECDEEDGFSVLTGLGQLVRDLPSFKIILTTRPKPYFDRFWHSQGGHTIFHLQDIEDKVVDGDIRLYLAHCLSLYQVQKRYPRRQWGASDEEIDSLVRAAGRLFIIASTAVRYILDKSASNPGAQMQKLLQASAHGRTPFKDLSEFYTIILRNVVPVDCEDDDIVGRYQSVVGAIISIQRPLPVSTIAHIIGVDAEQIHAVLDNLQSVILLGDGDVPRIYHKSFPDYLTDQARCKDPRLQIAPRIHHTQIATCCFKIMNKHLKYNILGLGDPARYMSNEGGLKEDGITDVQLLPQQLRYACVYWANHLEVANIEDSDVLNRLTKFVDEHTLHWFEVLSQIGNLDLAHRAIRVVLKLPVQFAFTRYIKPEADDITQNFLASSDLYQLLSDALHFISKFYEIIERSALHTYYSALPLTPTDSFLYRRYIKRAKHNVCAIDGGPERWDALIANLGHGERVDVVKFSFDGALFVSCSEESVDYGIQGMLKIWDAATGTPISTIPGHRLAAANDFSIIASSEENIITYYNMNGSARGTMCATSSTIQKLALSESSRIAAAFSDGSVWLWESINAGLIESFDGFDGSVYRPRLQFSPAGTRLAYSSANGIVKMRDGISGRFIADLQCGPQHDFGFSGDGSRIASLSYDWGLTLWNSESGEPIGTVRDVGGIKLGMGVFAISANGSLLATAYYNDQVKLWSENRDHLAQNGVLEERDPLRSMAFSLDNILAIATLLGIKLYNVKSHSFISALPFRGFPTALAFSPDYTHLAVGNFDGNVYLWDIRGIGASSPHSKEEATTVTALALSRDCSRLACVFRGGTVELWGTCPTKRRIAFHKAHTKLVLQLDFGPDGGLFASGSHDRTIKLWNGGDGSLRGTLKVPSGMRALALSNSMLAAAWHGRFTLWTLDTLSLIHTFETHNNIQSLSISDDSKLVATAFDYNCVRLFDVVNHTTLATFNLTPTIYTMTFLPDNSQLVTQSYTDAFLSLDLINKNIIDRPTLEDLIQLPGIPLWCGVPVCYSIGDEGQHYLGGLFSQHKNAVPVLWIPRDFPVTAWTQGSSMIALGCKDDGRVLLLRLPTSHVR